MVSLQQLGVSLVGDATDLSLLEFIVARHRRSSTLLAYSNEQKEFEFIRYDNKGSSSWYRGGSWVIPKPVHSIISVLPLESYDAFLLVATKEKSTVIFMMDLSGKVIHVQNIDGFSDAVSADIDQQRRELLIGFRSGKLLCYYIHIPPSLDSKAANNIRTKTEKIDTSVVHITLRRRIKIDPAYGKFAKQICCVDLLQFTLVLTVQGTIICYDTSRFDVLYILTCDLFPLIPNRLWVDKFGPKFLVESMDAERTRQQLELWIPPSDYTSCEVGAFGRIAIPLQGQILAVVIESVGVDRANTMLMTLTTGLRAQLWFPRTEENLRFECKLSIALPQHLYSAFRPALLDALDAKHDHVFAGLSFYFGSFSFCRSDSMLPNSPVLFEVGLFNMICRLGIHMPTRVELEYDELFMDLSIGQLQAQEETMRAAKHQQLQQQFEMHALQQAVEHQQRKMSDPSLGSHLSRTSSRDLIDTWSDSNRAQRSMDALNASSSMLSGGNRRGNHSSRASSHDVKGNRADGLRTGAAADDGEDEESSQISATLRTILDDMAAGEAQLNEFVASQQGKPLEEMESMTLPPVRAHNDAESQQEGAKSIRSKESIQSGLINDSVTITSASAGRGQ